MLPLVAGVSVGVGVFWWTVTLRHEVVRPAELRDNGRIWIVGSGAEAKLPAALLPDLRSAITETLRTGRLEIPADVAVRLDRDETFASRRSARPNTFRLGGPNATAVPDGRPRFWWTPAEGATRYRLNLGENVEGALRTEIALPAAATDWSPETPLTAGASYRWDVRAVRGDATLAHAAASFRVLSESQRAVWDRERSTVGGSNLLRGIVAARAGLLEEAAEEFRALGRQNPRAEQARLFLEQVEGTIVR